MGGRGSSSGISAGVGLGTGGGGVGATSAQAQMQSQAQVQSQQAQNQAQQAPNTVQVSANDIIEASKTPSTYGNNTVDMFKNMSDDQMAKAVNDSMGVDMPNHLRDRKNITQDFVYSNGMNKKPTVLSDSDFDNYLKDHNISKGDVLIREVDPVQFSVNGVNYRYTHSDVSDMYKMSDIQYIGGKWGGSAYGHGAYFGQVGTTGSTHYGSGADGVGHKSIMAVFDRSKARAIYDGDIGRKWNTFSQTHQKTAQAIRSLGRSADTRSIQALLMGYNVITTNSRGSLLGRSGEYYNVIDRSCLVIRANDRK